MTALRTAICIVFSGLIAHAGDFNLKFFDDGPIELHTTLTFEGSGERLVATAKNASGQPIQHAKICIASESVKKGCLFELWNEEVWAPEKELSWNVTTKVRVAKLSHDAMIEELDRATPSPSATSPPADTRAPAPSLKPAQSPAQGPEILTDETLITLAKAGLSDDVILRMISSQPGNFSQSPTDVVAMKNAGVSDKVISAILERRSVGISDGPGGVIRRVEQNARLYIAPMTANLNTFISAEIVKQKLPLKIVSYESDAEYILTGLSQRAMRSWFDVIAAQMVGAKDTLEASAAMVSVKDKSVVWAGESGDRSLIFGAFKRGGERKLAERIVSEMKRDLF